MRPLYTKFSLLFLFFLLSLSNSPIAMVSSVDKDLTTKDKTKETTNPIKSRNEVGGKNDRPKKDETFPSPTKKKAKVLQISPTIINEDIKTPSFTPLAILSKGLQSIKTNFNKETNYNKIVGPDPFRFTITSNKDSVAVGEEIELTIAVDWVDFGINNGVRFLPEWYKYTLRVVTPKGFTQTGGDYTDFCTKPVDANNPQAVFTIKGKFEYNPEEAKFTVLRGFERADVRSDFIWKGEKEIKVINVQAKKFYEYIPSSKNARIGARAVCDTSKKVKVCVTRAERCNGNIVKVEGTITSTSASNIDVYLYWHIGLCNCVIGCVNNADIATNPGGKYVVSSSQSQTFVLTGSSTSTHLDIGIGGNNISNQAFNCSFRFDDAVENITPSAPTVSGTKTISNGDSTQIYASGCSGTISWDNTTKIGSPIYVKPSSTTTYKARCTENNCTGILSEGVVITVNSDPCSGLSTPTINGNSSGCDKVTLTSSIDADRYEWWFGDGKVGSSKSYDATVSGSYILRVTKSGCTPKSSASKSITVTTTPLAPTTSGGKTLYPPNNQATLTVTSACTGGTITWDNTTETGSSVTVTVTSTTTFKAKCTINSCASGWSSGETVTVFGSVAIKEDSKTNTSNCATSDGSVTVSASGGSDTGFQFKINGGAYQSSGTFGNLSAGNHIVRAKDNNEQESANLTITISSPDAPAKPILTEYSKTINDGGTYTLVFPSNACPAGSSPKWVTNFSNPISSAGEYKGVCEDGSCASAETIFTLSINGRSTGISSTNPNCFNSGGSVTANNTGAGDCFYSLYNVGTNNFVSGQIDKYAGTTYTFTGISEGTYKVYIRPVSGTEVITGEVTLTKNCTGGYTISDVVLANCFGKNASFKATITNPQTTGYIYELVDILTNLVVQRQGGGTDYTFTSVSSGVYRIDIYEDRVGGGALFGNTTVDLNNEACANQGIVLSNPIKASCLGTNGGFTVSILQPTAGIGYIYVLVNALTNVQVGTPKAGGHSYTFTGIADGTYRVDVYEDKIGGGTVNGNERITIEKDCSTITAILTQEGTLNCTNDGGNVSIKIVSTVKTGIQQDGWFKYNLFEPTYSNLGDGSIRAVAKVITWIDNNTVFPVIGPDNAWTIIDRNTWIVRKIQKTTGSAYTPIIAGNYYGDVVYKYFSGGNEFDTKGIANGTRVQNDFVVTATPTGSVCGRSDGNVKLNFTCGRGKYNIFFYNYNQNDVIVPPVGEFPNFFQGSDYTFSNLPPGRYHATIFEKDTQGNGTRVIEVEDIIVPQLSIPITITPAENAAFCPGSIVTLGISNAPVGSTYLWTGVPVSQQTLASPVVTLPTTPGDYQFIARLTLGACNSGNVVRELTVRVPPVITITSNSPDDGIGTIETGDPLEVIVTPVAGRTYEWKYDATDPAQWTGTTIDPTVVPYSTSVTPYDKIIKKNVQVSDNGFYKVKVTDEFGCVNYNKTKVLIQPFQCKITAPGVTRCYIATNKRWAALKITLKNRKLNWRGDLTVKRIKDLEGELVTDAAIITDSWATVTTKYPKEYTENDKIPDGIYEVKIREKRSDEESGPGFQCEATEYITVGCQRKCKKLQPCLTGDCCGIPANIDLNQEIKLETLAINDVVKANDFEVIITKVTVANAANYSWNIEAISKVPVFDNVFIGLKSEDSKPVVFNECKELVSNDIITLYNPANWDKPIQGKAIAKALYESAKEILEAITTNPDVKVEMSKEDLANIAQQLREQAAKDLPKDLELRANEAVRKMEEARDAYQKAKTAGDSAGMAAATTKFNEAKAELTAIKAETDKYLNLYQRIVQLTLEKMWEEKYKNVEDATVVSTVQALEDARPSGESVLLNNISFLTEPQKVAISTGFSADALLNLQRTFKYFVNYHKSNPSAIVGLEQKIKVYEKTTDNTPATLNPVFVGVSPALKLGDYIYATMCRTCTATIDVNELAMIRTTEKALTKSINELFKTLVYTKE